MREKAELFLISLRCSALLSKPPSDETKNMNNMKKETTRKT